MAAEASPKIEKITTVFKQLYRSHNNHHSNNNMVNIKEGKMSSGPMPPNLADKQIIRIFKNILLSIFITKTRSIKLLKIQ